MSARRDRRSALPPDVDEGSDEDDAVQIGDLVICLVLAVLAVGVLLISF